MGAKRTSPRHQRPERQVVEVDPVSGEQIKARRIDPNKAQKPPGSGDLFGIAMTPAGDGFYFVEDENNTLVLAK